MFLTGRFDPAKNLMVDKEAVTLFNSMPAASEVQIDDEPEPVEHEPPVPEETEKQWGPTFQLGPNDEEF